MEETLLQEIQTKINLIIAKAMIVTCDEGIADPCSIYDDRRFIDLVIQPLLELAFIEQGDDLNNQSYSANELLKYFIDLVCAGWKNTCSVCERDFSCTLCQELPKGQTTLTQSSNQAEEGDICNGSNWGPVKNVFEPVPSKNDMINDTKPIPYVFIKRLKIILRSLFGFLEIICCQDQGLEERVEKWIFMNASVENIYGSYDNEAHIQNLDIDGLLTKARKHCVVLFESRTEDPQNTEIVLLNSNIQLQDPSLFLNAESCGYLCIKLLDYKYEGYEICGKIESFIRTCLPDSGIFCRVIKTCTLFLIKLSCTFMRFIKVTCLATSELHDIVPEILFKETSLPDNLFFNKGLYMGLRQHGYKILLDTILSFDKGSKYIARYYLKIFHMLFITILDDNNIRNYIFDITSKFMESPTLVVYLIENGFCQCLWISFQPYSTGFV
ncbi:hypothetical protein RF11_00511 [Thelohanellus kitauei]|uniref:Uncharacterized protein n=1 Tax=Thelohanellus kitauei TaxID=669202 RepID=A0A0C2J2L7_THEKT|nr:hypothetical protein RF11_00511 [Thelohanellus kitauei]